MERLTYWFKGESNSGEWRAKHNGKELSGIPINRLAQYEELEENELLMKLPCKLGAEVWYITPWLEICKAEITTAVVVDG